MNERAQTATVRDQCATELSALEEKGIDRMAEDTSTYTLGEMEGWRTCIRVLDNPPDDRTLAQALYTLAGHNADWSSRPKMRSIWDRERGRMVNDGYETWSLAWNRVISRVTGWLEAEYGLVRYEDVKDLDAPPLRFMDLDSPEQKRDVEQAVDAMLGTTRNRKPSGIKTADPPNESVGTGVEDGGGPDA